MATKLVWEADIRNAAKGMITLKRVSQEVTSAAAKTDKGFQKIDKSGKKATDNIKAGFQNLASTMLAGGGIVADSNAEDEWQESEDKVRVLLEALS